MWKVRRTEEDDDGVVLSLSGRLQRENLNELRRVFASEAAGHSLILDLKDLRLVDDAVVAFLANCEASGASLRNCPAYIREWISAEQTATECLPE
ncbi:MAG: STAS domain-containing protein [Terriglobales bacterium]